MIKVGVAGIAGRMGSRIAQLVCEAPDMVLEGGWERPEHEAVGNPVRRFVPGFDGDILVAPGIEDVITAVDVVVDFTAPEASLHHAEVCKRHGKPVVVGTTGFSKEQCETLIQYASDIPIILAPNMSVGVNVLFKLVEFAAKLLGDDFDVEIVEAHHRYKKDAPSGTAIKLGQVIAAALGRDFDKVAVYERRGFTGERTRQEIGMQTLRGGDIVGEHTILFAGLGERIEITHRAHSRDTFARGAIRAVRWIVDRDAGLYDMHDVLGLK